MLKLCLVFWESEPQYAYKRYAYKKKNMQSICHKTLFTAYLLQAANSGRPRTLHRVYKREDHEESTGGQTNNTRSRSYFQRRPWLLKLILVSIFTSSGYFVFELFWTSPMTLFCVLFLKRAFSALSRMFLIDL